MELLILRQFLLDPGQIREDIHFLEVGGQTLPLSLDQRVGVDISNIDPCLQHRLLRTHLEPQSTTILRLQHLLLDIEFCLYVIQG